MCVLLQLSINYEQSGRTVINNSLRNNYWINFARSEARSSRAIAHFSLQSKSACLPMGQPVLAWGCNPRAPLSLQVAVIGCPLVILDQFINCKTCYCRMSSEEYKIRSCVACHWHCKTITPVCMYVCMHEYKVKCALVQAQRLCTGRTDHRGSRGIALLFLDHGTRRGEGSSSRPGRSLPRRRPGTHCTGGWVGPRVGLDRCGKSRPHRDSIPGSSTP